MIIGFTGFTVDSFGRTAVMGAGKDIVSDIISDKFKYSKIALADPLKRIASKIWGFDYDQLWGPSDLRNKPDDTKPSDRILVKKHDFIDSVLESMDSYKFSFNDLNKLYNDYNDVFMSSEFLNTYPFLIPRICLQKLGTEVFRKFNDTIWADYTVSVAEELLQFKHSYSSQFGIFRHSRKDIKGIVISDIRFINELTRIQELGGKVIRIKRRVPEISGTYSHESELQITSIPDSRFNAILNNDGSILDIESKVKTLLAELAVSYQ